jgi:hypothetical protein
MDASSPRRGLGMPHPTGITYPIPRPIRSRVYPFFYIVPFGSVARLPLVAAAWSLNLPGQVRPSARMALSPPSKVHHTARPVRALRSSGCRPVQEPSRPPGATHALPQHCGGIMWQTDRTARCEGIHVWWRRAPLVACSPPFSITTPTTVLAQRQRSHTLCAIIKRPQPEAQHRLRNRYRSQ